jgi:hypothetical protein
MSRDAAEQKAREKLKKLKAEYKKNGKKKINKPLNMGREAVEKRRIAELERIRKERKAAKQKKSINKENKILNTTKYRSALDKLEKIAFGIKDQELKDIEHKEYVKKLKEILTSASNRNKGGLMKSKKGK